MTNLVRIRCEFTNRAVILYVIEPVPQDTTTTYGFTIDNVANAISTKTTETFKKLDLRDKGGYKVVKYEKTDVTVTNLFPAEIVDAKLI